jgi:hypothetical protein
VLKGQKAKPKFKPSGMETETEPDGDADGSDADDKDDGREGKRAGSSKRSKTQQLTIHETLKVPPQAPIPEHARFNLKRVVGARRGPFPARGGAPPAAKSRLCRGR